MSQKIPKTIFVVLFFFFSSIFTYAQDYDSELSKAKKEDKPVILYFYSRYCPICDLMERNVILDKTVKKILDRDVVFVWVDGEKRKDLVKAHGVWGFPTVLLLEPEGKRIAILPGYVHKEIFLKVLNYLKGKHYKKIPLKEYLAKKG
ncbi:MAG: thioredoxin family protein [Desulfobacterota bacterium]|nr:thioredoxin family protein [Thermodesulfobacteriota bacterium]MDW8001329.1 thioredoxin family protein [Deltaproteobacteria bacterium]